jgi:tRNA G18 (ribose-2'-O)-methylase SpoU
MPLLPLSDSADPRLEEYRNVPDPELVERSGIFIAEGRLVVRRLLIARRFETRSVMVTDAALAALSDVLDLHGALPVYVVPQHVMNTVTGFNIHRGCLAVGVRRPAESWRTATEGAKRAVVLERVSNADNVGSIFRNAAAFGADAVLLGPACADPLYRKAIRTSMAAALSVPFARADPWPEMLSTLRSLGWAIVSLTPAPNAPPLDRVAALVSTQRAALLLGHEGNGLSQDALELSTHRARIPMAAGTDSINVATAAAIAMYAMRV